MAVREFYRSNVNILVLLNGAGGDFATRDRYAGEKWELFAWRTNLGATDAVPLFSDLNNPHGFVVTPEMASTPGIGISHAVSITFPDDLTTYFPDVGSNTLLDPVKRGQFIFRHYFSTSYFGGGYYEYGIFAPLLANNVRTLASALVEQTDEDETTIRLQKKTYTLLGFIRTDEGLQVDEPVYVDTIVFNWGDGTVESFTPAQQGTTSTPGTPHISHSDGATSEHIYQEAGNYVFTVTITDQLGRITQYSEVIEATRSVTYGSTRIGAVVDPATGTLFTAFNEGGGVRVSQIKRKSGVREPLAFISGARNPSMVQDAQGVITLGYETGSSYVTVASVNSGRAFS